LIFFILLRYGRSHGTSNTQSNARGGEVEKELTLAGEEPLHREGYRGGTWVLLDYGCVVVQIFND